MICGMFPPNPCMRGESRHDHHPMTDCLSILQVLLSQVWHGNKLGVAYYDLDCPQICFMPDRPEPGDFVLLQQSKSLQCMHDVSVLWCMHDASVLSFRNQLCFGEIQAVLHIFGQ